MELGVTGLNKAEAFFVEFDQTYIHGNTLGAEGESAPKVLFLHGGDELDSRDVFWLLRVALLDHYEIASCAFDFIGHGTTGGERAESSLYSCTMQAANIINACFDSQPLTIVASGMSTYTAIKLTQLFSVAGLVLIAPKVFSVEKYHTKFVKDSSFLSRFPDQWDKTDAWSVIEQFRGRLSIVGTDKNDPMCPGTMSRLYSHAIRAKSRQALEVSDVDYSGELMTYCNQTPAELIRIAQIIKRTSDAGVQKEQVYFA